MASPFRVFRRYQKSLLIVAGVILIFVFVLDDSLRMLLGGTRGNGGGDNSNQRAGNAVAVRWNGGRLTNSELEQLVFRRRVTNSFQRQIYEAGTMVAQQNMVATGIAPPPFTLQPAIGPDRLEEGVERDVVRTRIFADAARAAGMRVSDEEIRRYLSELGRNHVPLSEMQAMIRRIQSGSSAISSEFIFNAIREELLSRYYRNSLAFALSSVMPQQQWEDWLQVNDRVSIEAAGLPAESFLVDVKAPSDAELAEYYDKFKEVEPRPELVDGVELPSPTPGFRIPRKIEVQYVRADYNKILDKLKSEVTDEEVQAFYDKNKDPSYIKLDTDLFNSEKMPQSKPQTEADGNETQGDAKQPATAVEGAKSEDPRPGAEGEMPAADAAPAGDKRGDPAGAPPAGGGETPSNAMPGKEAAADKSASTSHPRRSTIRLAAFEQPASPQDANAESEPPSSAATQPATTQPAATSPATAAPAGAQGALPATSPSPTGQPAAGDSGAAAASPASSTDAGRYSQPLPPKKPVEFLPLDDQLRDKIRTQLAAAKVDERLNELIAPLEAKLSQQFGDYYRAAIDARELKQPPPPEPRALADLSALAEENSLEYRKVGPASQLEVRDDKVLGQLIDVEHSGMPMFYTLFSKDVDLYKPIATTDADRNRYILVKSAERARPRAAAGRDSRRGGQGLATGKSVRSGASSCKGGCETGSGSWRSPEGVLRQHADG